MINNTNAEGEESNETNGTLAATACNTVELDAVLLSLVLILIVM